MSANRKARMDDVILDITNNDDVVNSITHSGFSVQEVEAECIKAGHGSILSCVTHTSVCQLTEREISTIKFLVSSGCDVDSVGLDNKSSIYINAIRTNNIGLASVMLELGAKPYALIDDNAVDLIKWIDEPNSIYRTQVCGYKALEKVLSAEIKAGLNIHPQARKAIAPLANTLSAALETAFIKHRYSSDLLTATHVLIKHGAKLSNGIFAGEQSCLTGMLQGEYYIEHLNQMLAELDERYGLKPVKSDYEVKPIADFFNRKLSKNAAEAISTSPTSTKTSMKRI